MGMPPGGEKRPGGGWRYVYTVAAHFLPAARDRSGVPPVRKAVSQRMQAEEKPFKKKEFAGFGE